MPKEEMLNQDTTGAEPTGGDLGESLESQVEGVTGESSEQEPPKFKYKSQAEAEKAYLEANRKMTEATEKAARYEKMIANLSKPQTEQAKESAAQRIGKEAIAKIRQIPDTDPQKEEKAAIIWAEAQDQIADLKYQQRHSAEMSQKEVETYAETKAKAAGLKSPIAVEAFWLVARNAPKNISLDEQITWSIEQVNGFIEEIRKENAEKTEEDEEARKDLKVLGKGGRGPSPSKTSTERATTAEILKSVANQRRLKEKDFNK